MSSFDDKLNVVKLRSPAKYGLSLFGGGNQLCGITGTTLTGSGRIARKGLEENLPHSYNRCFGSLGALAVSAAALVLAVIGALLCLRSRASQAGMRLFQELLALLAVLAGAAWLALGLDGWRKKKEDSFLSAVLPVFFCGVFLILFYKTYAQLPALRYTLYPFLGLCAALAALHLIAGFTLGRVRPRLTLFLCGAGIHTASIRTNGDITACLDIEPRPELVQGNISKDLFSEVWKNRFEAFRVPLSDGCKDCKDCEFVRWCAGGAHHSFDYDDNKQRICMKGILF